MKYSIVPEIIHSKKIKFFNKSNVEVTICNKSSFKYFSPFVAPSLTIDTFAKKTTQPEELVNIDRDELKKLGFIITSIKAGNKRWFKQQVVIYRIESISNRSPDSKRMQHIPSGHQIQRDKINNKIKLIGPNAGWPRKGNGGPWIEIIN